MQTDCKPESGAPLDQRRDHRRRDVAEQVKLDRANLELWASSPTEVIEPLRRARPELPDALGDRAQDVGEPLLAIADLAGGQWPKRARTAVVNLCAGQEPDEDTLGVRLLSDCRGAFDGQDRISTHGLLAHLHGLEEAPWGDWYSKPLPARKLANMLSRYGIESKQIRVGDKTPRGYLREHFADAWDRYLPPSIQNIHNTAP